MGEHLSGGLGGGGAKRSSLADVQGALGVVLIFAGVWAVSGGFGWGMVAAGLCLFVETLLERFLGGAS